MWLKFFFFSYVTHDNVRPVTCTNKAWLLHHCDLAKPLVAWTYYLLVNCHLVRRAHLPPTFFFSPRVSQRVRPLSIGREARTTGHLSREHPFCSKSLQHTQSLRSSQYTHTATAMRIRHLPVQQALWPVTKFARKSFPASGAGCPPNR